MRKPKKRSSVIRRPSLTYSSREEREWRREDRKFVIVVAEIVSDQTSTHVHELAATLDRAEVSGESQMISELPVKSTCGPSELPNNEDMAKKRVADVICGLAELPADIPVELSVDVDDVKRRADPV
jgi:hypothetical protein